MITSINEFKKQLFSKNINEYYNRYDKLKGTIYFRNLTQKILWDNEMSGQISDGHWENSSGNSWVFWTSLNTDIDANNPRVDANMAPERTNFNLSSKDLLDNVGDRMIAMAKMSKITKDEKVINAAEYLGGYVKTEEDFNKIKSDESNYSSKYLKIINNDLFNKWLNVPYTRTNLIADLNDMKDIMKTIGDSFNRSVDKSKKRLQTGFDKKDTDRIVSLMNKAGGNDDKAKQLATSMANKIKDGYKAIRRGRAAEDENYHTVAQVFFDRAKELGVMESVNTTIPKASDFKVEDKILYTYSDPNVNNGEEQKIYGKVGDHFGDGIHVVLDNPIKWFDEEQEIRNNRIANPMGYPQTAIISVQNFDVYDNEHYDFSSFKNITKINNVAESVDDESNKFEDMLHINLLDKYSKNGMIKEFREKFQEFKHKIRGFKESLGILKIGDIIEFTSGYNDDIRYTTEILGFDEDDEIYLLWDAYWAPIKNDTKRAIKVIDKTNESKLNEDVINEGYDGFGDILHASTKLNAEKELKNEFNLPKNKIKSIGKVSIDNEDKMIDYANKNTGKVILAYDPKINKFHFYTFQRT